MKQTRTVAVLFLDDAKLAKLARFNLLANRFVPTWHALAATRSPTSVDMQQRGNATKLLVGAPTLIDCIRQSKRREGLADLPIGGRALRAGKNSKGEASEH